MAKKLDKELLSKVTFFVGAIATIAAGMVYVLATDLLLRLGAAWMMIAIILALGSGICEVLSDTFKEKRTVSIVLKSVAIGLSVLFVAYMFIYMAIAFKGIDAPENIFYVAKYTSKKDKIYCIVVVVVCAVIAAVSAAAQTTNLVLTATTEEE